jgi:hypothetical protein
VDEKVDIFSLGNNFFGILTGVGPFYKLELEDEEEKIIVRSYIDFAKVDIYKLLFKEHSFLFTKKGKCEAWDESSNLSSL